MLSRPEMTYLFFDLQVRMSCQPSGLLSPPPWSGSGLCDSGTDSGVHTS